MDDFNQFLDAFKNELKELAKTTGKDFKEAAIKDGTEFLEKTKEDLKLWTQQVIEGDLSKEDYEFLVKGKKDLAEMAALTQAGLSLVEVEKFRNSVVSWVATKAVDVIVKL